MQRLEFGRQFITFLLRLKITLSIRIYETTIQVVKYHVNTELSNLYAEIFQKNRSKLGVYMTSTPLLSIITPSYNYGHYLPQAIDSIVNQDFPTSDLELIIIDDASKDNSAQIIQEYANKFPYIRAVQYKENKGVHYLINQSMDLVRGKYIHWLAADDFRSNNFLKRSMEVLLKNPQIGMCCSDFGYTDAKLGRFHLLSLPLLTGISKPIALYTNQLIQILKRTSFWIPGHTTIVRTELVFKYGKFNKELQEKCDWFLFHQIALHEGVIYIPEVLAYFYTHENSYSSQNYRSKLIRKSVAKEVFSLLDKPDYKKSRKLFYKAAILGWAFKELPFECLNPKRFFGFLALVCRKLSKFTNRISNRTFSLKSLDAS